jgi:hypothetical protein
MKVKLEFNLPEEKDDFLVYFNGSKYFSMINEFERYLRHIYKYEENPEEVYNKIDEVRKKFYEIFNGYDEDIS